MTTAWIHGAVLTALVLAHPGTSDDADTLAVLLEDRLGVDATDEQRRTAGATLVTSRDVLPEVFHVDDDGHVMLHLHDDVTTWYTPIHGLATDDWTAFTRRLLDARRIVFGLHSEVFPREYVVGQTRGVVSHFERLASEHDTTVFVALVAVDPDASPADRTRSLREIVAPDDEVAEATVEMGRAWGATLDRLPDASDPAGCAVASISGPSWPLGPLNDFWSGKGMPRFLVVDFDDFFVDVVVEAGPDGLDAVRIHLDGIARTEAKAALERLAQDGDADAQFAHALSIVDPFNMWNFLDDHDEHQRDVAEARAWFRRAAEQGHADAQYHLAALVVHDDAALADDMYLRAAQQGHVEAQRDYGLRRLVARGRGAGAEAREWLTKAGEQGDARAAYELAWTYRLGKGGAIDEAEARAWFRRAADGGLAAAQRVLGEMLLAGAGGPREPVEARRWLTEAAEGRDSRARVALAEMMIDGVGGDVDVGRARELLEAARSQRHDTKSASRAEELLDGLDGRR